MASRFRLVLVVGIGSLILAGCGDAGPVRYAESERLAKDLKDKPKLQDAVRKALADLYGDAPNSIKAPPGMGLLHGGARLAGLVQDPGKKDASPVAYRVHRLDPATWHTVFDEKGEPVATDRPAQGGYSLYRQHCLHCHGVSGDGAGPTADFLYPRPRDYRKGLFKFTSTTAGAKPTRDDLRKTIRFGLHGTSMPAFDALMVPEEIEQVIDYMIFLSMRGETELGLIEEAMVADESDPNPLPEDVVKSIAESVFAKWNSADSQVLAPPVKRTASSAESIARGRTMFLGRTTEKLECWGCHGPRAEGNGPSFIDQRIFNKVVFERKDVEVAIREVYRQEKELTERGAAHHGHGGEELHYPEPTIKSLPEEAKFLQANLDLWKQSIDDWGFPLRPANLNLGVYKGGRRPIDIYWRIAKGINGAKMPAHASALKPEQIWDLVYFVLALPYQPELLEGATAPGPAPVLKADTASPADASAPRVATAKP